MVYVRSAFCTLTIGCCEGGYIVRYLCICNMHYTPSVRNNARNKKKKIKDCTKTQLKLNVSREEYV